MNWPLKLPPGGDPPRGHSCLLGQSKARGHTSRGRWWEVSQRGLWVGGQNRPVSSGDESWAEDPRPPVPSLPTAGSSAHRHTQRRALRPQCQAHTSVFLQG